MQNSHFAYRFWEVVPREVAEGGAWPEHNIIDPPRPPRLWNSQGFSRSWHTWKTSRELADDQVEPREAFSLAWAQPTQQCWIAPGDCTVGDTGDGAEYEQRWTRLSCRDLRPGLWQLLHWGSIRHHDSSCPDCFDEFLPRNFFTSRYPDQPCHFVGKLSLILGLLAMWARDAEAIVARIDKAFYRDDHPQFLPYLLGTEYTPPIDKYRHPGRALVMQTGIIRGNPASSEIQIKACEDGLNGPMISSRNPTEDEMQMWGI